MIIAFIVATVLGLYAVLLSLENDNLRKNFHETKKTEVDRLYKLSVIKEIQGKIVYTNDHEKIVDIIMVSLRNFLNYSMAASMVLKDAQVIFTIYTEEDVNEEYIKKVEQSMLSSLEKLVGKLPPQINKKIYGAPIKNAGKSTYLSSFHSPLIANNKVLALLHLSSTSENAYSNMEDLHEIIDAASTALTHFSQTIELETKKYSSLINNLDDGIFMVDSRNNLLTINNSATKILGISVNANFLDISAVFPQNLNLADKTRDIMLSKKPDFQKEIQINGKILDIFINPVGQERTLFILRNVTEFKKKELLKEDLLNIMIHELRSPATAIKDSVELIITDKETLGEDRKLKFLEIIHQQAKKILGQIGSILDAAKLDAGKLVLQKTKGDIAKLVKDEIRSFVPQAERKNISLSFELLPERIPEISFDEIRISQVIDNLLSNSLKFTPEGGKVKVKIDCKVIPPVLEGVSPMGEFLSLDKYIVISVSDNGIGIKPEQQKLLFAKYMQAKDTTEELAIMGTGLGLYLIKGIVESHQGRIWVKSAQGQGTTFSFSLPATDDTKASYEAQKTTVTSLAKPFQTVN